jgi:TRAP-type C4-dicarboxylate transport system permease large subunit
LFIVVVGGLYGGVFTASEAGAVGATGALGFAAARGKLTRIVLFDSMIEAGKTTAMIFAVAFGGMVFANFVTMSGLTSHLVSLIGDLHLPVGGVILVIVAIYIVLGSLMEAISMMLLTVPVFSAVLAPLGVNMIWFGIFVAMMIEIGMIHPPVGMNVFMVKTMMPELSIRTIFRGTIPFLVANLLALGVIVAFPDVATWLPGMSR